MRAGDVCQGGEGVQGCAQRFARFLSETDRSLYTGRRLVIKCGEKQPVLCSETNNYYLGHTLEVLK